MQPGSDPKSTSSHFRESASFLTLKPVSARTVIKVDSHGGENCLTRASSSMSTVSPDDAHDVHSAFQHQRMGCALGDEVS